MKKYYNTHKLFKHLGPVVAKNKADYASNFIHIFRKVAYEEYWTVFIDGGPTMSNYVSLRIKELAKEFENDSKLLTPGL